MTALSKLAALRLPVLRPTPLVDPQVLRRARRRVVQVEVGADPPVVEVFVPGDVTAVENGILKGFLATIVCGNPGADCC